ncbi:MAG: hypothetical protein Q7S22_06135 [Candidatus Micrarchaeota archaeon]|nr:hypothetical protein [Candidatus Micrarchaeota archaeon]
MELYTTAKVSPKGKLNIEDFKNIGVNILKFTAPALGVFFAQLAMGVEIKAAALVAAFALYALLSDFFKKFNDGKK